jgi:hypothetical protein
MVKAANCVKLECDKKNFRRRSSNSPQFSTLTSLESSLSARLLTLFRLPINLSIRWHSYSLHLSPKSSAFLVLSRGKILFYFVSPDSRWRKIFAYASRLGLVFSETFFLSLECLSLSTKLNHKSARAEHLFRPLCVRKTIASQRLGCFVLHYMSNSRLT